MTTTQDKPAVDQQELPEDFTSAWASVLLDVFEKQRKTEPDESEKADTPASEGGEVA
jgi:hypothetical protein